MKVRRVNFLDSCGWHVVEHVLWHFFGLESFGITAKEKHSGLKNKRGLGCERMTILLTIFEQDGFTISQCSVKSEFSCGVRLHEILFLLYGISQAQSCDYDAGKADRGEGSVVGH